jgi:PAS domain S-box-containing protein
VPQDWLKATVSTVRELMLQRIQKEPLDGEARREMEMAIEELDVMWEELQGQAALLSRENERYADFFEYAPDAYIVTDAGGNVREVNQAAIELFGVNRQGIVGKPLGARIPESERGAFLSHWVGVIVGDSNRPAAWRGKIGRPDGATVEVDFSVRSIPLKKSGVGGICWLIRPLA